MAKKPKRKEPKLVMLIGRSFSDLTANEVRVLEKLEPLEYVRREPQSSEEHRAACKILKPDLVLLQREPLFNGAIQDGYLHAVVGEDSNPILVRMNGVTYELDRARKVVNLR